MRLLDNLWCRVRSLAISRVLYAVIEALELIVDWQGWINWLVHYLIVSFEVCSHDFPVKTKKMLKNIAAHDSKESVIFFLQLLAIRVFDGVDELIIECLIHNNPIFNILCPLSCWSWSCYWWASVAFDGTVGYTPGLGGLSHAVVERVVYSVGFMMIPMSPWCPPPYSVGRVTTLVYKSCIISLMVL